MSLLLQSLAVRGGSAFVYGRVESWVMFASRERRNLLRFRASERADSACEAAVRRRNDFHRGLLARLGIGRARQTDSKRIFLGIGVAFSANAFAGCLPYVVPPGEASVGLGPSSGSIVNRSEEEQARDQSSVVQVKGTARPLGMFPELHGRAVDVGIGWQYERADLTRKARGLHGPLLAAEYYPITAKGKEGSTRFGARGTFELMFARVNGEDVTGKGASLGAIVEYTGFTSGNYEQEDEDGVVNVGAGFGEWAIGAYIAAAQRQVAGQSYWAGFLGVNVRWPFAFGVMCCVWPDPDSDDDDSSSGGSDASERHRDNRPDDPDPGKYGEPPSRTPADPQPGPTRTPAKPKKDDLPGL